MLQLCPSKSSGPQIVVSMFFPQWLKHDTTASCVITLRSDIVQIQELNQTLDERMQLIHPSTSMEGQFSLLITVKDVCFDYIWHVSEMWVHFFAALVQCGSCLCLAWACSGGQLGLGLPGALRELVGFASDSRGCHWISLWIPPSSCLLRLSLDLPPSSRPTERPISGLSKGRSVISGPQVSTSCQVFGWAAKGPLTRTFVISRWLSSIFPWWWIALPVRRRTLHRLHPKSGKSLRHQKLLCLNIFVTNQKCCRAGALKTVLPLCLLPFVPWLSVGWLT